MLHQRYAFSKKLDQCSNPNCQALSSNIVRAGFSRPLKCLHGMRRQRFRCKLCKTRIADNHFKLHFRLKHADPAINSRIFQFLILGLSNRKIAKVLDISEHSVQIRIKRLAQSALSFHQTQLSSLKIFEPLCYDGLENFAGSQYEPNYINQAIGRDSLFIYDFNFASLNRKGRMSKWQKNKLAEMVSKNGRFNPKAIRIATKDLILRLYEKRASNSIPFTILSDEHFQYKRAIFQDLKEYPMQHVTVSSRKCRNFQNILFSVNHADLLIRQSIAAFARETISFSKTAGAMCQKYALFMVYKNYMTPQFTKEQVRRHDAHLKSPAQKLDLFDRVLNFSDIFFKRSFNSQSNSWNEDWKSFWNCGVPQKYHRQLSFRPVSS
jgi:transposase-like protein